MRVTDNTIDIACAECGQNYVAHFEIGIKAMIRHIREHHRHYSALEADAFATDWMEAEYDAIDRAEQRATEAYQHEKRHRAFWGHK